MQDPADGNPEAQETFDEGNGWKGWCFTAYWQTEEEREENRAALQAWGQGDEVNYLVFGDEVAKTTGREHFQGYVELEERRRLTWLKKNPKPNNWHWAPRWSTPEKAGNYCKKEGRFWEFGERSDLRAKAGGERGATTTASDWQTAKARIQKHKSWRAVANDPALTNYLRRAMPWARDAFANRPRRPLHLWMDKPGFRWQGKVARFLVGTRADDRSILWIVDARGGRGKSKFCKWLLANLGACSFSNESLKNTANAYDGQSVVFIDVPREDQFFNFASAEKLKDACLFNDKYECCTKWGRRSPHVLVFTNHPPPRDVTARLTLDRLHVLDLGEIHDGADFEAYFPRSRFRRVARLLAARSDPLEPYGANKRKRDKEDGESSSDASTESEDEPQQEAPPLPDWAQATQETPGPSTPAAAPSTPAATAPTASALTPTPLTQPPQTSPTTAAAPRAPSLADVLLARPKPTPKKRRRAAPLTASAAQAAAEAEQAAETLGAGAEELRAEQGQATRAQKGHGDRNEACLALLGGVVASAKETLREREEAKAAEADARSLAEEFEQLYTQDEDPFGFQDEGW